METSMFLRSNLRDFGIGNTETPYAMRYFLREKGGAIQGVAAVANSGSLMMQATEGLVEICDYMQSVLPDDTVYMGILGDSAQARIMREAFGLKDAPTTMDDVEPLFSLELENLIIPPSNGAILRKPEKQDVPMLNEWGYDYFVETGLREAGDEVRETVKDDVARRIEAMKLRLLVHNGKPVAQTGFNAVLPDSVQIGGVYTPPEFRCNGYGRLAVALHLEEVRKSGVKQAILFSANEYASRAYRGIGFEQIGHYTLTMFATSETKE
jgi:RimJ/RimL family protein N-acetyltransferase